MITVIIIIIICNDEEYFQIKFQQSFEKENTHTQKSRNESKKLCSKNRKHRHNDPCHSTMMMMTGLTRYGRHPSTLNKNMNVVITFKINFSCYRIIFWWNFQPYFFPFKKLMMINPCVIIWHSVHHHHHRYTLLINIFISSSILDFFFISIFERVIIIIINNFPFSQISLKKW